LLKNQEMSLRGALFAQPVRAWLKQGGNLEVTHSFRELRINIFFAFSAPPCEYSFLDFLCGFARNSLPVLAPSPGLKQFLHLQ
jgi:hypothetical protein